MWRLVILGVIAAYTVVIALAAEPAKPKPTPSAAPAQDLLSGKAEEVLEAIYGRELFASSPAELKNDLIAAYVWNQVSQELMRTPAESEQGKQRRAALQKLLAAEPEKKAETYYLMVREQHTLAYQAYCAQREAEAAGKRLPPK